MYRPIKDSTISLSVKQNNPLKMELLCRILVYILATNVTPFEIWFIVTQLFNFFELNLFKLHLQKCQLLFPYPISQVCLYFFLRFSFSSKQLYCDICPSFPGPLALNSIIKSDLEL